MYVSFYRKLNKSVEKVQQPFTKNFRHAIAAIFFTRANVAGISTEKLNWMLFSSYLILKMAIVRYE